MNLLSKVIIEGSKQHILVVPEEEEADMAIKVMVEGVGVEADVGIQ